METILVVDDDPHIREVVCFALEQAGYHTVSTDDGVKALALHKKTQADLVVLDVLMPELDGLEVCRQLRAISNVPIVFLSSRDEEVDRVLGLELGADDYVVKPFSPRELVARVRANLRRQASNGSIDNSDTPNNKPIQFEGLRIDTGSFSAHFNNTALTLTQTEFQMLRTLAAHPSKVFSRDALMDAAYDVRRVVSHRTIDSHIRRLRDKLRDVGAPEIHTVHGIGYCLQRS